MLFYVCMNSSNGKKNGKGEEGNYPVYSSLKGVK